MWGPGAWKTGAAGIAGLGIVIGAVTGYVKGYMDGLGLLGGLAVAAVYGVLAFYREWVFAKLRHVGLAPRGDGRRAGWLDRRWKKRRQQLKTFARAHGLGLAPHFRRRMNSLPGLPRWVYDEVKLWGHVLAGRWQGRPVQAFDVGSISQEFKRVSLNGTFVIVWTPYAMPQLRIWPEGVLDKACQVVGSQDIDTESAEFNRAFCVRCDDAARALEALTPQVMDLLLQRPQFHIEFHGQVVLLRRPGCLLDPREIGDAFELACALLNVLPDYLIEKRGLKAYDGQHDAWSE
jgi:hypothetical protein